MEHKCKNCKYCEENLQGDPMCVNPDSEYLADFVEDEHFCEDFEYANS